MAKEPKNELLERALTQLSPDASPEAIETLKDRLEPLAANQLVKMFNFVCIAARPTFVLPPCRNRPLRPPEGAPEPGAPPWRWQRVRPGAFGRVKGRRRESVRRRWQVHSPTSIHSCGDG